jgi:hypothetical protein
MTSHPVQPSRRERLLEAIALEEARLDRLEGEQAHARNRLATLRSELASLGRASEAREASELQATSGVPETPQEKVRLFRSLFRGRTDVFPTRFVSRRTGKAGYAPACRNQFVPSVCELPKIRCGECPNQAFLPFDDAAVLAHLTGRQVLGLYPLLEDETCWLRAVDFDKGTWTDDVIAFAETCRRISLPAAIERSRSGKGAHVWFFFSAPVARRLLLLLHDLAQEDHRNRPGQGPRAHRPIRPGFARSLVMLRTSAAVRMGASAEVRGAPAVLARSRRGIPGPRSAGPSVSRTTSEL